MKSITGKIFACIGGAILIAMVGVCIVTSTFASRDMNNSEDRVVEYANQKSVVNVTNYLTKYVTLAQQAARDRNAVGIITSGTTMVFSSIVIRVLTLFPLYTPRSPGSIKIPKNRYKNLRQIDGCLLRFSEKCFANFQKLPANCTFLTDSEPL